MMDEYRSSMGSDGRAATDHIKQLFQGTQYAERMPIGLPEIIQGVSGDVIKAFYERWYHPKHMAVVVVGDLAHPDAVVDAIKRYAHLLLHGYGVHTYTVRDAAFCDAAMLFVTFLIKGLYNLRRDIG